MVNSVGPTTAEVKTADIKVAEICAQYPDVFKNSLGLLKATQAKLYLREGSTPKICKPRTIPFGIKYQVETEIKRLVLEEILEKVNFSDWATPIVPILKSDGSIWVCSDYKVTINPELQVGQHPMLTIRNIFASLGGSQYFSKIDLSQAFNQIELSPESQRLTTINTPWGLFQYTRLCFGIANSPAIFQRCLDNALQGLSGVVSRVDDILIATATVEGRVNLLKQMLERL